MDGHLILAIDQGTTNTKALLVDPDGAVRAEASVPVPIRFPQPGWVESDAAELWQTVDEAVGRCLAMVDAGSVAAVGIANQRETTVAWDAATGQPVGPAVTWQCRRSAPLCDELRARGLEPLVRRRTGLGIDPMFSAGKARWLIDHAPDGRARAERGAIRIGTVDAWVAWNLSGGAVFATDATNASRTGLMDLDRVAWDPEMLEVFDIPSAALPTIRGSSAVVGSTVARGAIPGDVPIASLVGDSHGALFGHGAPPTGSVKATFGTGTSVMAPVARPVRSETLSATVAWSTEAGGQGPIEAVHALEGNITATGAAIAWLAGILGLEDREAELEALAASVEDTGGVYLVPAFTGLGAPHWDADARGLISGLSRGTTRAHLARATFEAVAWQVQDVLEALRPAVGAPLTALYADGGAMRSQLLAQAQADVCGLPVLRNPAASLAALGAAYLAGLAVGTWRSADEIRALPRTFDRVDPRPGVSGSPELAARYAGWRDALRRAASRP